MDFCFFAVVFAMVFCLTCVAGDIGALLASLASLPIGEAVWTVFTWPSKL